MNSCRCTLEDGQLFPSKSIEGLLAGLKQYMKIHNKYAPYIFSEEYPCFLAWNEGYCCLENSEGRN